MRIALEELTAYLDRTCDDWSNGVDHGMEWPLKIVACKHAVVNQAWSLVDTAFDLTGGAGVFKRSRFEQLFRDARLGRIHPGNSLLTHKLVGKMSLGVDPNAQPRLGLNGHLRSVSGNTTTGVVFLDADGASASGD